MCHGIPVATATITLTGGVASGFVLGSSLVQGLNCGQTVDLVGVAVVNTGGIPLSDFVLYIQRGNERPYSRIPYSEATTGTVYPVSIRDIGSFANINFGSDVNEPGSTSTTLSAVLYAREPQNA